MQNKKYAFDQDIRFMYLPSLEVAGQVLTLGRRVRGDTLEFTYALNKSRRDYPHMDHCDKCNPMVAVDRFNKSYARFLCTQRLNARAGKAFFTVAVTPGKSNSVTVLQALLNPRVCAVPREVYAMAQPYAYGLDALPAPEMRALHGARVIPKKMV